MVICMLKTKVSGCFTYRAFLAEAPDDAYEVAFPDDLAEWRPWLRAAFIKRLREQASGSRGRTALLAIVEAAEFTEGG
jgi:hypothetical protein